MVSSAKKRPIIRHTGPIRRLIPDSWYERANLGSSGSKRAKHSENIVRSKKPAAPLMSLRVAPAFGGGLMGRFDYDDFGGPPMGDLLDLVAGDPLRDKMIYRWAMAVRDEYEMLAKSGELATKQNTSILSDTLQRELNRTMTFDYGPIKDLCEIDRTFYLGLDSETMLCDLSFSGCFIAQGWGDTRQEARESASEKALIMFQRPVTVFDGLRNFNGKPGPVTYVAQHSCYDLPPACALSGDRGQSRGNEHGNFKNGDEDIASNDTPEVLEEAKRKLLTSLPWLQVNPKTIGQVGVKSKDGLMHRLSSKSMEDFFVILNNRGNSGSAVEIMNNSAQFNQMKIQYLQTEEYADQHKITCRVMLDEHLVAQASAFDFPSAKRKAADMAVKELRKTQPTIQLRHDSNLKLTPSDLRGYADRFISQGGTLLGDNDDEINNRMKEPKLYELERDTEAYLTEWKDKIQKLDLINNAQSSDQPASVLKFGSEFTHDEKMAIHKAACRLKLLSKPYCPPTKMFNVVSIRYGLLGMKQRLLDKGQAGRYALLDKGTRDLKQFWEENNSGDTGGDEGTYDDGAKDELKDEPEF